MSNLELFVEVLGGASVGSVIAVWLIKASKSNWCRRLVLRPKYKKILWAVAMRAIENKKVYFYQESGEHWFLGDEDVEGILWACVQHNLVWRMHQYPELTELGKYML